MIRKIDHLWIEHLLTIDHLRTDVHMRTVGQKDPLLEFKHESFALFDSFSKRLRLEISRDLFRFEMLPQQSQEKRLEQTAAHLKRKSRTKSAQSLPLIEESSALEP